MVQAQNTMRRIGLDLINEKRRTIGRHPIGVQETVGITKKDKASGIDVEPAHGRDLLSVLSQSSPSIYEKTSLFIFTRHSPFQHIQYTFPTHVHR